MSGMQKIDLSDQSGCEIPKSENPSFWEEERRRQLEAIEASRQGLEEACGDLLREVMRSRDEVLEALEEALGGIRTGRLATMGDGRAFTPQVAESSVDRWAEVVAKARATD